VTGFYGYPHAVRLLTRTFIEPGAGRRRKFLPRDRRSVFGRFSSAQRIIYDAYDGVLSAPQKVGRGLLKSFSKPQIGRPLFEEMRLCCGVENHFTEYRKFSAYAPNL